MKNIILFIVVIFTIQLSNAQNIKTQNVAPEIENTLYSFALNDNLINVQSYEEKKISGFIVSILDKDLNTINSSKIEASNSVLHNVSYKNGKLLLLIQENNESNLTIVYNVITIDTNDLSKTEKKLYSLNSTNHSTISRFFYQNSELARMGRFDVSEDNNYFSLSIESRINKQKTKTITVLFLNSDYEILFKKQNKFEWKENDEKFQYRSSFINSHTKSLYVLNSRFGGDYKLELINNDGYKIKDFNFQSNMIKMLNITGDKDDFYCLGFYSNNDRNANDGIFYSKFSNDLELLDEKEISYSKQLLEEDQSKLQQKKGLSSYKPNVQFSLNKISLKNNDLYLFGELQLRLYNDGRAYDDIIVACLTKNGELNWSRLVQKNQNLDDYNYTSYKTFFIKNNFTLLFNSALNLENIKQDKKSPKPFKGQKLNLFSVNFNEQGEFDFKQITNKKTDFNYLILESNQLENEKIVLFGNRKKENKIMTIEF